MNAMANVESALNIIGGIRRGKNVTQEELWQACDLLDAALRAQLPSQGGEAVAVSLELVENLKYGGMHIRKWDNLAGLSAGTHKLYTHPADQVTGGVVVSRELLNIAAPISKTVGIQKQVRKSASCSPRAKG